MPTASALAADSFGLGTVADTGVASDAVRLTAANASGTMARRTDVKSASATLMLNRALSTPAVTATQARNERGHPFIGGSRLLVGNGDVIASTPPTLHDIGRSGVLAGVLESRAHSSLESRSRWLSALTSSAVVVAWRSACGTDGLRVLGPLRHSCWTTASSSPAVLFEGRPKYSVHSHPQSRIHCAQWTRTF